MVLRGPRGSPDDLANEIYCNSECVLRLPENRDREGGGMKILASYW
jgi:hypothetical protein